METIPVIILPDGKTAREKNRLVMPSPTIWQVDPILYQRLEKSFIQAESSLRTFEIESDKKTGKTFTFSNGELGCGECCNKDRCSSEDCDLYYRKNCPHCLGTNKNLSCYIGKEVTAEVLSTGKIRII